MEHKTWMPKSVELVWRSIAGFMYRSFFYGAGWIFIVTGTGIWKNALWVDDPALRTKLEILGIGLVFLGFITEFRPVRKMMKAEEG